MLRLGLFGTQFQRTCIGVLIKQPKKSRVYRLRWRDAEEKREVGVSALLNGQGDAEGKKRNKERFSCQSIGEMQKTGSLEKMLGLSSTEGGCRKKV